MAMDFALVCASLLLIFLIIFGIAMFFKLARIAIKWLITIILNSIVGILFFFLLRLIGISIPLWPHIVPVALFGLPALATMLILKFLGVPVF
jgi:hypothetical protein